MKLAAALKRIAADDAEAKREHEELRKTIAEQAELIRKLRNSGLTGDQGQLVTSLEVTTQALTAAIEDDEPATPPAEE